MKDIKHPSPDEVAANFARIIESDMQARRSLAAADICDDEALDTPADAGTELCSFVASNVLRFTS